MAFLSDDVCDVINGMQLSPHNNNKYPVACAMVFKKDKLGFTRLSAKGYLLLSLYALTVLPPCVTGPLSVCQGGVKVLHLDVVCSLMGLQHASPVPLDVAQLVFQSRDTGAARREEANANT